jgi:hypothetical protein
MLPSQIYLFYHQACVTSWAKTTHGGDDGEAVPPPPRGFHTVPHRSRKVGE